MCEIYVTSNKHTCNINLKKIDETLRTEACNIRVQHCNICIIPIYFCNIHIKHLQHAYETLETYACNMSCQRNISACEWRLIDAWSSSVCRARRSRGECHGVHVLETVVAGGRRSGEGGRSAAALGSGGDAGRQSGGEMARWTATSNSYNS
jgi:hypothetical protein